MHRLAGRLRTGELVRILENAAIRERDPHDSSSSLLVR
jgi:hypothetical protein